MITCLDVVTRGPMVDTCVLLTRPPLRRVVLTMPARDVDLVVTEVSTGGYVYVVFVGTSGMSAPSSSLVRL